MTDVSGLYPSSTLLIKGMGPKIQPYLYSVVLDFYCVVLVCSYRYLEFHAQIKTGPLLRWHLMELFGNTRVAELQDFVTAYRVTRTILLFVIASFKCTYRSVRLSEINWRCSVWNTRGLRIRTKSRATVVRMTSHN